MNIKTKAEQYAEKFRLIPETKGWYQQKVDDFTAGYKEALRQFNVSGSLPSHIECSIEAKNYGDEMNKLSDKPNGFHELNFYNGTIWLRQKIEDNNH